MTAFLPPGYESFRDTVSRIHSKLTKALPSLGHLAKHDSNQELWRWVDRNRIELFAFGSRRDVPVAIKPDLTWEIPLLRKVCGFTYLRPMHPRYSELMAILGSDLSRSVLVFRKEDAEELALYVLRLRRRSKPGGRQVGRPSLFGVAEPIIIEIFNQKGWITPPVLKELQFYVAQKLPRGISEASLGRYLDRLWAETDDSRFRRL